MTKMATVVHGQTLRFNIVEWDETEESVIYHVYNDLQSAYYEVPERAKNEEQLAVIGVSALAIDGLEDFRVLGERERV